MMILSPEPLAEPVCDPFYEAVADWDDSLANLSRFFANERDRSAANLAPCACGHIALFCSCEEDVHRAL